MYCTYRVQLVMRCYCTVVEKHQQPTSAGAALGSSIEMFDVMSKAVSCIGCWHIPGVRDGGYILL